MPDGTARYPHLLSPLSIGNVTVRNRIMQTAHGKGYSEHGSDTHRDLEYHLARARGGIGLIVTGGRLVHPTTAIGRITLAFRRDAIAFDRELTAAVHEHGAKMFAQLAHLGSVASSLGRDDLGVVWGPSGIEAPHSFERVKEMELEDIDELVESFAISAEHAREGGYDGVELHFAHGYLVSEFLSPRFNQRRDEYGGSDEARLLLPRRIIAAVRERVGRDFVVGARIGMTDFLEGGLTIDGACDVARALEADGAIDYLSVSGGGLKGEMVIAPSDVPAGQFVDMASQVKRALSRLALFMVGSLGDPDQAESLVASGHADMIAMTRAQIADPELARKLVEDRADEITHCIRGNQGCIGRVRTGLPLSCTVNPIAGREGRLAPLLATTVERPQRWLVAGGGPAGMKAAATLASRGHEVVLAEAAEVLGGQVNAILRTVGRETFRWLVSDLDRDLATHGVDVRLRTEVTPALVAELHPDHTIVATGAVGGGRSSFPLSCDVDTERREVLGASDVLDGSMPHGTHVVVLDGEGTRYTAGLVEMLLDAGKDVELVTKYTSLFPGAAPTLDLPVVSRRVLGKGLRYRLHSWIPSVTDAAVTIDDLLRGVSETIECDALVISTPLRANDSLYRELKALDVVVHRIGDCVAPRRLDQAIYEGLQAGLELFSTADRFIAEGELEHATRGALVGAAES